MPRRSSAPQLAAILLCTGCRPEALARIPGAVRLSPQATGEVLVGTTDGELWSVSSFGDAALVGDLGAPITDLITSPVGLWHARLEDGAVFTGTPWTQPQQTHEAAMGLIQMCDGLHVGTEAIPGFFSPEVSAVAFRDCSSVYQGTRDGHVEGERVSDAAIRRILPGPDGLLWLDSEGHTNRPTPHGMLLKDISHAPLAPFIAGEVLLLDQRGTLWID